jgi:hypothetical protein
MTYPQIFTVIAVRFSLDIYGPGLPTISGSGRAVIIEGEVKAPRGSIVVVCVRTEFGHLSPLQSLEISY